MPPMAILFISLVVLLIIGRGTHYKHIQCCRLRSEPHLEDDIGQAPGRPAHLRDRPPMPASSNAGFNASRQLSRERVANAFAMLQNMADMEGSRCAPFSLQSFQWTVEPFKAVQALYD